MFKNVFVLKKLHVIMPNPLKKKKMVTLDIRKHLLHYHFTSIFFKDKKRFALKETRKPKNTGFPGMWDMKIVTKPAPIYHYVSGYLKQSQFFKNTIIKILKEL